jgi:formylglycine-generating enzyme required for sulfatase activity
VQNAILAKAETAFTRHAEAAVEAALRMDLAAVHKAVSDTKADPAVQGLPAKVQALSETGAALDKAAAAAQAALEALKDGKEHAFEKAKDTVTGVVTNVTADEIAVQIKIPGGGSAGMRVRIADLVPAERMRLAGAFKPESASEYVAHGIIALAAGDAKSAKADLAHAADHPLAPTCQSRLDEKLLGAVEAAAKTAWDAIVRAAGVGKVPEAKAKELLDRIKAFEAEHGKTAFAAGNADKLAALTERLSGQLAPVALDLGSGLKMEVVLINPGKFMMGSPATEAKRTESETPHAVTITQPYFMGRFPVTQEQFEAVMGRNPSQVKMPRLPVDMVSWIDAQEFCRKAGAKIDKLVRLPSEAEWEYACRAGSTTAYAFGDNDLLLGDYAWFKDNSEDLPGKGFASKIPHPVGAKKPNAWGLYDMHGNVSEWCQDWFDRLPDQAVVDPQGPAAGKARVLRGGSCDLVAGDCRSAFRLSYPPERVSGHVGGFGFRVAVTKN